MVDEASSQEGLVKEKGEGITVQTSSFTENNSFSWTCDSPILKRQLDKAFPVPHYDSVDSWGRGEGLFCTTDDDDHCIAYPTLCQQVLNTWLTYWVKACDTRQKWKWPVNDLIHCESKVPSKSSPLQPISRSPESREPIIPAYLAWGGVFNTPWPFINSLSYLLSLSTSPWPLLETIIRSRKDTKMNSLIKKR